MRFGVTMTVLSGALLSGAVSIGVQQGQHAGHQETREPIQVSAMHRDMLLAEMRDLLGAVNGVLRGLSAGDTALLRASAERGGMAAMMRGERMGRGEGMPMGRGGGRGRMGGEGSGMVPMMPEGFRTLLHSTRGAFDSLATQISRRAPADTVVARLAAITSNCVACHAAYRLEVVPR